MSGLQRFHWHRNTNLNGLPPEMVAAFHKLAIDALDKEDSKKTFILDGSKTTDTKSLLEELAKVCSFPDYFGHNWDALNDSLGEIAAKHSDVAVQIIWNTQGINSNPDSTAIISMLRNICEGHRVSLVLTK